MSLYVGLYPRCGCQEGHVCLLVRGTCIYSCRLETGKCDVSDIIIILVPIYQAVIHSSLYFLVRTTLMTRTISSSDSDEQEEPTMIGQSSTRGPTSRLLYPCKGKSPNILCITNMHLPTLHIAKLVIFGRNTAYARDCDVIYARTPPLQTNQLDQATSSSFPIIRYSHFTFAPGI
jgi:hypothetical protein